LRLFSGETIELLRKQTPPLQSSPHLQQNHGHHSCSASQLPWRAAMLFNRNGVTTPLHRPVQPCPVLVSSQCERGDITSITF
jgi:hypothetical protein